ncbi:methyl-accepting chemotaxis protein [Paraburkholderia caballeronis]|uniref:Methyl-accepting chemotaxis sensory transducer with TarH sensor n=1 Tax=Paraburkholderia caballeronis TaxID=416943 RepID=A0A1H7VJ24_9BURK|nr:methyl-accepting chemotaxis protein [Paraburkholderia caballeronis]PXW16034.1 methyl-accepting chemotaxis sensory transducer with TarH sensor [Paraburkholderia caballeronis]PXW93936.1 methyl-accepting chemotaxis sensory transducer with TarH sensor [Paraburkholderia caballeronis]RAJ89065.1 methyl-accepting chemotaxis sensory transducer with TarH sensor [Paraburkholderia caballeronis]SED90122.1 methyl-accepting chemotaxis sensory transducer with TarH sensor [Paraburkholderia caballeronis]SEM0
MFSKIRVSTGLLCVLVAFCVLQLITEGLGWWSLTSTHADVDDLSSVALRQTNSIDETTQHLMDARLNLARAGTRIVRGGTVPADIIAHAREELDQAARSFDAFTGTPQISDDDRARVAALAPRYQTLHTALGQLAQYLESNNLQAYLDQPTQSYQDAYLAELASFVKFSNAASRASLDSIDARLALFRVVSAATLAVLVVLAACVYAGLRRGVVAPLEEAGQHFERIARGRLDERIAPRGSNEIGRLFHGLAAMQASLARTVHAVRESADSIHTGANEIAAGNTDLSARTESQAASLEETAASMEQLTGTVRNTADNAHEANVLAESALDATSRGSGVVNGVVERMHGIAQSSDRIAEIIGVIDGIAFQTNILALNAAVEAARAGEQGRGFAVVAGEVRALAQRSAQSAKEIKTLISESVEQIRGGSELVGQAGGAMREVSESISRVAQMMAGISASSREQSAGIEQVNQAVSQMDQMTQQNAALVEEAAAAAASLYQQTEQLKDAVAAFVISPAVLADGDALAPAARSRVEPARKFAAV